jgi:hypothetical protein
VLGIKENKANAFLIQLRLAALAQNIKIEASIRQH